MGNVLLIQQVNKLKAKICVFRQMLCTGNI